MTLKTQTPLAYLSPTTEGHLRPGLEGVRAGVPKDPLVPKISQEVEDAFRKAVETLEELGMTIEEVSLPHAKAEYTTVVIDAVGSETSLYTLSLLGSCGGSLQDLSPDVRMGVLSGLLVPASVFVDGQRARRVLVQEFDEALQQVDVILTPSRVVPGQTIDEGRAEVMNIDGELVPYQAYRQALSIIYNLTGLPALTLPCGFSQAGVPIGLQMAGRPFEEATVLRVAHAYEQATTWHRRRPPI